MNTKRVLSLLCALLVAGALRAQVAAPAFGPDGRLKIAQLTDTHLDLGTPYRRAEAEKTLAQLRAVLEAERPDLVLFTGDVVTGRPARKAWERLVAVLAEYRTPFCVVLGNHDAEQDLTRAEIARIVTSAPGSLNRLDAAGELADLVLEVPGARGTAALLYCLDSHDYSTVEGVEGYGWFTPGQIAWYRERSAAYTAANGGAPLPALAFFHIALPEYVAAWRNPENTHVGRAAEEECPGAVNAGMFAAMVEQGDVVGVFVGHDHDIDYVVAENGIALGYGRFSGDDTTYNNLRHGVRLLLLCEGERGFETWIRERDGRIVDRVRFAGGKITKVRK
ncbi:metallophosphoesterase family protein [uncultured Alistipes sp.]|uniref:metallophosphoesterase family protein n=1 Tax=uncultured Alistipes sp. TaxID=538949 RepID=UPI00261D7717|nr:metallophosphoesterase family protein [uncultured Alistipes sp.]